MDSITNRLMNIYASHYRIGLNSLSFIIFALVSSCSSTTRQSVAQPKPVSNKAKMIVLEPKPTVYVSHKNKPVSIDVKVEDGSTSYYSICFRSSDKVDVKTSLENGFKNMALHSSVEPESTEPKFKLVIEEVSFKVSCRKESMSSRIIYRGKWISPENEALVSFSGRQDAIRTYGIYGSEDMVEIVMEMMFEESVRALSRELLNRGETPFLMTRD